VSAGRSTAPQGRRRRRRLPHGQRAANPGSLHVTLSESGGVRYLHFGTEWVQGAMRIARPFALELEYQQQMMAPLLFLPQPARIVQLGLGAAALAKYCHRCVPSAHVTVVEISLEVIDTARRWFNLPPDDERLDVVAADARDFIADPRRRRSAEWLQVDLYDAQARGPVYDDPAFYVACRRALAEPGVAVFNLFGRSFEPSHAAIAGAFGDRALVLPEADAGNRIVLAFAGPPLSVPFRTLHAAADAIEAAHRLPARKWVTGLRAENGFPTGRDVALDV
jgi:spermidine synthase